MIFLATDSVHLLGLVAGSAGEFQEPAVQGATAATAHWSCPRVKQQQQPPISSCQASAVLHIWCIPLSKMIRAEQAHSVIAYIVKICVERLQYHVRVGCVFLSVHFSIQLPISPRTHGGAVMPCVTNLMVASVHSCILCCGRHVHMPYTALQQWSFCPVCPGQTHNV